MNSRAQILVKFNSSTKFKTTIMDIMFNVLYVIGQIECILPLYITIKKIQEHRLCFLPVFCSMIISIILLLKFITMRPKLLWTVLHVMICVIINCGIFLKPIRLVLRPKLHNTLHNKDNVTRHKIIFTSLFVVLLFIMSYVMYSYYIIKNSKLIAHTHWYFVISNFVLTIISTLVSVIICFIPNETLVKKLGADT